MQHSHRVNMAALKTLAPDGNLKGGAFDVWVGHTKCVSVTQTGDNAYDLETVPSHRRPIRRVENDHRTVGREYEVTVTHSHDDLDRQHQWEFNVQNAPCGVKYYVRTRPATWGTLAWTAYFWQPVLDPGQVGPRQLGNGFLNHPVHTAEETWAAFFQTIEARVEANLEQDCVDFHETYPEPDCPFCQTQVALDELAHADAISLA